MIDMTRLYFTMSKQDTGKKKTGAFLEKERYVYKKEATFCTKNMDIYLFIYYYRNITYSVCRFFFNIHMCMCMCTYLDYPQLLAAQCGRTEL